MSEKFDLVAHLERQRAFSAKTFGPGARTKGVLDHIRKELAEIEADPSDIREWVDVIILAFDGAWRAGWEPELIVNAIVAKQTKNEGRVWPDWRTADPNKAIEHDRSHDAAPSAPASPTGEELVEKAIGIWTGDGATWAKHNVWASMADDFRNDMRRFLDQISPIISAQTRAKALEEAAGVPTEIASYLSDLNEAAKYERVAAAIVALKDRP